MRRRLALWAVLVALAVGAGAVVLSSGGGGSASLAKLPLASGGGAKEAAGTAADMSAAMPFRQVTYAAGKGLPALGGKGNVYSLEGDASDAAVSHLAEALGVHGKVQRDQGRVFVEDGTSVVEIYVGPGLPWSYSPTYGVGVSGGGSVSSSSGVAVACAPDAVCKDMPPQPEPPTTVVRPADLPSKDEATKLGVELVKATGVDIGGAKVTAEDYMLTWGVIVDPVIDGLPAVGYSWYVTVGSAGKIESASGYLTAPKLVDAYPLLDTAAAIDRLNNGGGSFGGGPVPMGVPTMGVAADGSATSSGSAPASGSGSCKPQPDGSEICQSAGGEPATTVPCPGGPAVDCAAIDPAPTPSPEGPCPSIEVKPGAPADPTTITTATVAPDAPNAAGGSSGASSGVCAPPEPIPTPEPVTVTITGAERILLLFGSWDGSKAFLVPGYQLTGDDGSTVTVAAVPDEFIAPPKDQTKPAPDARPPTTGTVPPSGIQPLNRMTSRLSAWVFAA